MPRGGTVTVRQSDPGVRVEAASDTVRPPPFVEALDGAEVRDPRAVQPMCIARLAEGAGWRVEVVGRDGAISFRTAPR